jgi:carbon-monoxide dehydrogenase large subunit
VTHENEKFGRAEAPGRSEDARLLTGGGEFTADLSFPNMAHAVFIRSPHGHADIKAINVTEAATMDGVIAVYTAQDFPNIHTIPCRRAIKGRGGRVSVRPDRFPLAKGRVRHVGEAVAVIIADTKAQAEDAAVLVDVDYAPLDTVTQSAKAIALNAPQIWDDAPNNLCLDWERGDEDAVNAAFETAAHRVSLKTRNNRLVVAAMEPRAAIGVSEDDRLTLYACSQGVMTLHGALSQHVLKMPPEKIRVISGDVGGGFGMKTQVYPEYPVVMRAAEKLGRPVKWVASRSESFLSDNAGRDSIMTADMAFDKDGVILALRYHALQNVGAYLSASGPSSPTNNTAMCLAGCYRTPEIYTQVQCVFTNTAPLGPYRGAGRPEAAYMIERLMDMAADETGIDRVEIRRRNFVTPDQMPYTTPLDITYDTGEFEAILDKGLQLADWNGFATRRDVSEKNQKIRGLGIATFLEHAGAQTVESARIEFDENGGVILHSGAQSQGQGHIDSLGMLVAETLRLPRDKITVVQGDSDLSPTAGSTTGSRTMSVGGGAFHKAALEIIEKAKILAADHFECAVQDVEFEASGFRIAGTDQHLAFETLIAQSPTGALNTSVDYEAAAPTFPNGCHIAEVEIDPATGAMTLERYTGVDDSGRIINHMVVDGQLHGGIAQGAGQVMMEDGIYGDDGQLLAGSFMDYAMPRADTMPSFTLDFHPVHCTSNAIGVKGAGESGTIGSIPAVMNAVTDALKSVGVPPENMVEMPATPNALWRALTGHAPAG